MKNTINMKMISVSWKKETQYGHFKQSTDTSLKIMLSSGSGLPNICVNSHHLFGYVSLRSKMSKAFIPGHTVRCWQT